LKLHTVCESAKCPNHWECWEKGTATFMIAGDRCTRACGFCAVSTAKPLPLEADEPGRVAEATRRMRLRHIVITAVARDDLADGGADHFRKTVEAVRELNPGIVIEVLVPDFNESDAAIEAVLAANPHIFNHNLETVRRLTPTARHRATYDRSLSVLRKVKAKRGGTIYTKSGLMLGLGEKEDEVMVALEDLRSAGCDILTLGQYLQPTLKHLPVVEFVSPEKFEEYGRRAGSWALFTLPAARWCGVPTTRTSSTCRQRMGRNGLWRIKRKMAMPMRMIPKANMMTVKVFVIVRACSSVSAVRFFSDSLNCASSLSSAAMASSSLSWKVSHFSSERFHSPGSRASVSAFAG
jgi:lipoic acid synthetase